MLHIRHQCTIPVLDHGKKGVLLGVASREEMCWNRQPPPPPDDDGGWRRAALRGDDEVNIDVAARYQ